MKVSFHCRGLAASVAILSTIILLVAAFPLGASAQAFQFRKGIGVHHALNWAAIDKNSQYVFPPFADEAHAMPVEQVAAIRAAGFDFVRLTVDPGPFLQWEGEKRDAVTAILLDRVRLLLSHDLNVIVNFHPNSQVAAYQPRLLVAGRDSPLFQSYVRVVSDVAQALEREDSNRIALEFINEPVIGGDAAGDAKWQAMLEYAWRQLRARAPRLMLVLPGSFAGNIEGLVALDPRPFLKDPATVYTFHYYEPFIFSHQNSQRNHEFRFLSQVPYPPSLASITATIGRSAAAIARSNLSAGEKAQALRQYPQRLNNYRRTGFDAGTTARRFDLVAAWAKRHGIAGSRILLGEFGVIRTYGDYHGAAEVDRARWLTDVRRAAEQRGFAWSLWAYRGFGGMASTVDDHNPAIDPATASALGLKPRR